MPSLRTGLEFIVDRPIGWRFVVTAMAVCRSGQRAFARILRIRRDRVWLDELPDDLLRDIGIDRSEIPSITRLGSKSARGGLWV